MRVFFRFLVVVSHNPRSNAQQQPHNAEEQPSSVKYMGRRNGKAHGSLLLFVQRRCKIMICMYLKIYLSRSLALFLFSPLSSSSSTSSSSSSSLFRRRQNTHRGAELSQARSPRIDEIWTPRNREREREKKKEVKRIDNLSNGPGGFNLTYRTSKKGFFKVLFLLLLVSCWVCLGLFVVFFFVDKSWFKNKKKYEK